MPTPSDDIVAPLPTSAHRSSHTTCPPESDRGPGAATSSRSPSQDDVDSSPEQDATMVDSQQSQPVTDSPNLDSPEPMQIGTEKAVSSRLDDLREDRRMEVSSPETVMSEAKDTEQRPSAASATGEATITSGLHSSSSGWEFSNVRVRMIHLSSAYPARR